MLTQSMVQDLQRNESGHAGEIAYSAIRGLLEKGQMLYRFNRNRDGLDIIKFVGFIDNLSGHPTAIVSNGTKEHHTDLRVENQLVRDILLSTRGSYDSECYFMDSDIAKRKLKRFLKKKLEKQISDLEE